MSNYKFETLGNASLRPGGNLSIRCTPGSFLRWWSVLYNLRSSGRGAQRMWIVHPQSVTHCQRRLAAK